MSHLHEAGRLRRAARDPRTLIWFTGHGGQERLNDGISKIDVTNMLGRCLVTLVEIAKDSGEEEWRAEGTDIDGRKITAVVVMNEEAKEIRIVTAWANK